VKIIIILASVLGFCFFINIPAFAQQGYSIVYDLYYNLMLYPENGDNTISRNQTIFDGQFYSCLSAVQQRAQRAAQQHTAQCNMINDLSRRAKCEQGNEGAKLWTWTRRVRSACQGQILWSQTDIGQVAIIGKNALESMTPGQYENIVKTTVPQWRSFLMCQ